MKLGVCRSSILIFLICELSVLLPAGVLDSGTKAHSLEREEESARESDMQRYRYIENKRGRELS